MSFLVPNGPCEHTPREQRTGIQIGPVAGFIIGINPYLAETIGQYSGSWGGKQAI